MTVDNLEMNMHTAEVLAYADAILNGAWLENPLTERPYVSVCPYVIVLALA